MSASARMPRPPLLAAIPLALVLALAAEPLAAQEAARPEPTAAVVTESLYVRDVGPGEAGRVLRRVLAGPHVVVRVQERLVLPRDSTIATSLVVIGGGDLALGATVRGDVVVIGGDLFMHTGGFVAGDAIAIGGGVYRSTLATIEGRVLSFRDITFDAVPTPAGLALDYRILVPEELPPLVSLPGIYGVRLPTYDRVNGLSLPLGPRVNLDSARITIDPLVVYRTDLGAPDPLLLAGLSIGRRDSVSLAVGRGTFTNDAWIRSDLWNSLISLVTGKDTRNYFRADRAEARLRRRWEGERGIVEAWVGGRAEDAWSVGPYAEIVEIGGADASAPWSLFGSDDVDEGMLRPNPRVDEGRIVSALAGGEVEWERADGMTVEGYITVEQGIAAPDDFSSFTQVTVDGEIGFPTFGTQRYRFSAHGVFTGPGIAPRQRWAYLGGSGTLPTFDLLEFGGDELVFIENRYIVPMTRLRLPIFGAPVVTLRHMLGAAGPGRLPDFEQNLGLRVSLFVARVDYTIDPASGDDEFSVGVALTR